MSIFNSKKYSGLYPVVPLLNGEGKGRGKEKERGSKGRGKKWRRGEGGETGKGCVMAVVDGRPCL